MKPLFAALATLAVMTPAMGVADEVEPGQPVMPYGLFDWPDRPSIAARDGKLATLPATKPRPDLLKDESERPKTLEDLGLTFGGSIYVGIAVGL